VPSACSTVLAHTKQQEEDSDHELQEAQRNMTEQWATDWIPVCFDPAGPLRRGLILATDIALDPLCVASKQAPKLRCVCWRSHKVLALSHHGLTVPLDDVANGSLWMPNSLSSPKSTNRFGSELVWMMRSVLEAAVEQIDVANRTPATKAKMAERILREASHGVTDPEQLKAIAIEDGKQPAD
jgi:hypothetical protein